MDPILMCEEYWRNSHFSIARHYGGMKLNGVEYAVVNKAGKTLIECSIEAEREGREMAIEAGEPADLIDRRFIPHFRRLGRDRFIDELKAHRNGDAKDFLKHIKTIKK